MHGVMTTSAGGGISAAGLPGISRHLATLDMASQRNGACIMGFSTQTSVGDLLDNESTKAILEQVLPGIASHPQIGMARGMSLAMAAQFSGGLITQDALDQIDTALKALG
jgi:hypothetical protein